MRCHKFLKNNGLLFEELANSEKFDSKDLRFALDLSTTTSNYAENLDDGVIAEMIKKWKTFRFGFDYRSFRMQARDSQSYYIFALEGVEKFADLKDPEKLAESSNTSNRLIHASLVQIINQGAEDQGARPIFTNDFSNVKPIESLTHKHTLYIGHLF